MYVCMYVCMGVKVGDPGGLISNVIVKILWGYRSHSPLRSILVSPCALLHVFLVRKRWRGVVENIYGSSLSLSPKSKCCRASANAKAKDLAIVTGLGCLGTDALLCVGLGSLERDVFARGRGAEDEWLYI